MTNYDLEENIEHYHDKCIEMEMNLLNLKDIWQVVTNWESFEQESNEKKVGDLVVQEVMVSLNSIKEEISRFCKRSFDSRIEIHMTLQTKLSILEGNFSLIEDFRSKAIKSRHWEIISKVCGFDAIRDGEEVIDVLTLEDFINLGLEKQGSEIKSIIGKFIDFNIWYQLFEIDGSASLQICVYCFLKKKNSHSLLLQPRLKKNLQSKNIYPIPEQVYQNYVSNTRQVSVELEALPMMKACKI